MTTAEYVTDVPYVRTFVRDLSPLTLRLIAALNGFPSPPGDDFDYCEIGCGHGDTTTTLAAAYPRARFLGIDLNAEHIAIARRASREGQVENVGFLDRDFEQAAGDVPELDFLVAHGVLAWISPAKRKALLDLASAKLKPGGLLYVSYNTLPGWAAVEPLRRILLDRGDATAGTSLDRARAGVAFAKMLDEGGAAYFTENPGAREMLQKMQEMGLSYVVHEYLNAHWNPMYFTQVAAEMAASDLYFVGQLPLHFNYRDLAVPASLARATEGVTDRLSFEALKDYANNTFFRRDVFVKGKVLPDAAASAACIDAMPFGTLMGEGALSRDVRLRHHTLHFVGDVFDALFPALSAGATSIDALVDAPGFLSFDRARIRDAVTRLAIAHQVSPMMTPTRAAPAPAGPLHVPSAYNRAVLRAKLSADQPIVLASTVAGTGIQLPMLEGVILRLLTEVPEAEWTSWLSAFAQKQPFRIRVGDRTVETNEERVRVVLSQLDAFRERQLPRHVELGIVTPRAPETPRP